jgi:hypothetical protein
MAGAGKKIVVFILVAALVAAVFNGIYWLFYTYLRDKI